MLFEIRQESRAFLELAGKAVQGTMKPHEQQQFDRLLKDHPDFRPQFRQLQQEVKEAKHDQLWERGLRVLLRVPHPDDRAFLESVRDDEPEAWEDFLRGAYVLKVMAESMKLPVPPSFSNEMTADEETRLFAAVRAAQAERKRLKSRPRSK